MTTNTNGSPRHAAKAGTRTLTTKRITKCSLDAIPFRTWRTIHSFKYIQQIDEIHNRDPLSIIMFYRKPTRESLSLFQLP